MHVAATTICPCASIEKLFYESTVMRRGNEIRLLIIYALTHSPIQPHRSSFPRFRNQKEMAVKKVRRGNHGISHFFSGFRKRKKNRTCSCECVSRAHIYMHVGEKRKCGKHFSSTTTMCDSVGKSGKENLKNVHRPQLRAIVDDSFLPYLCGRCRALGLKSHERFILKNFSTNNFI